MFLYGYDRKRAWERDRPTPELAWTTTTARKRYTRPGGPGPQRTSPSLTPCSGRLNFSKVRLTPLPTLNDPTPEQAFLVKNYDENARGVESNPRRIFRTLTDAPAGPAAGCVESLCSSSFSLPTVKRALVEIEGGQQHWHHPWSRETSGNTTSPILGSTTSRMHYEVLQNFFQSLLSPQDRCYGCSTCDCEWETGGDGAEDVKWEGWEQREWA